MLIFLDHTEADLAQKDTELTAGLGVAIGLMAIELVSKHITKNEDSFQIVKPYL